MRQMFAMRGMRGGRLGWLQLGFFKIPDKPLKIGDSWTETKRDTLIHENKTTLKLIKWGSGK